MKDDNGNRLARLLAEKQAALEAEKQRRREFKDYLTTFDVDIARLVDDINSGQGSLFEAAGEKG